MVFDEEQQQKKIDLKYGENAYYLNLQSKQKSHHDCKIFQVVKQVICKIDKSKAASSVIF